MMSIPQYTCNQLCIICVVMVNLSNQTCRHYIHLCAATATCRRLCVSVPYLHDAKATFPPLATAARVQLQPHAAACACAISA